MIFKEGTSAQVDLTQIKENYEKTGRGLLTFALEFFHTGVWNFREAKSTVEMKLQFVIFYAKGFCIFLGSDLGVGQQ